ncbi:PREDICTED: TNF receptor-associated factor 4-like [Amphimedon queenslandica]|uniref:RING-type E3 ubiquitin transferase n=1 Tax=Amphimedon queenslandica TaxID=400682 RepID=A0AAN0III1_AMPQE|nr:PREDICTED: TNF receptor-associated factor 4-like [Amphimedon queenslandica]|eukprot:XP_003391204.1 PREDICTED: TNF receptor-associated factor 4-like [Amphimedon queenslandica]
MATNDTTYGGYSCTFVDGDPPVEYQCYICRLVARDPQQVSCCSNIYCKSCLDTLKEKGQRFTCPTCRSSLEGKYFKDGRVERGIKSLKVYCTNTDSGCQWMGTIKDIDTHLIICPYQVIHCTNKCGEKFRRDAWWAHITINCPKRQAQCTYCLQKGPHQLITSRSHLNKCPDLPIQCSNEGCNEKIPRRLLASHNETCPKAIVPCEYSNIGCNERIIREELEIHNDEAITIHLQLTTRQMRLTNEKLQDTNEVLQEKSEKLKETNEELKETNEILKETIEELQKTNKKLQKTNEKLQETNVELQETNEDLQLAKETIQSLQTELQEQNNLLTVSNEVLKVSQCSQKKKWHSPGFYTSPGGYKMSLSVYPYGTHTGEGTHVSCFIYLMAGEYDDILEWPFQGEVTIELLNQLEDKNHWKRTFSYDESVPTESKKRVFKGENPQGWGRGHFIPFSKIVYDATKKCQYLKDDSLYFRVSVKATSKTKPWLVST